MTFACFFLIFLLLFFYISLPESELSTSTYDVLLNTEKLYLRLLKLNVRNKFANGKLAKHQKIDIPSLLKKAKYAIQKPSTCRATSNTHGVHVEMSSHVMTDQW